MTGDDEARLVRFSEILGQERAKRILTRTIEQQRIPHAYLFTGIAGIGKISSARALAAALNCKDMKNGEPCGHCISCKQMKGGNFPDFILLRPEGEAIKIDQIRELQKKLRFAPVSGGHRVCVVDQAETMTEEASNAFLKSLEEPPPGNVFVLSAIEPLDLLPTIVSRCQRISFVPLSAQVVTSELCRRLGLNHESAMLLARISEGSLGKAIKMVQGDYLEKREKWLLALLKLRRVSMAEAFDQGELLAREMKKQGPEDDKYKIGCLTDMLGTWSSWYRDLILVKAGQDRDLLINRNFSQKLQKEAIDYSIEKLCQCLFTLDRAQRDLRMHRNPSLVLGRTLLYLRGIQKG